MLVKLDYGSGSKPYQDYSTSDIVGTSNYDYFIQNYKISELSDGSCESIHCRNVIHHIPETDLHILFSEFKRLLKEDGTLIISEPRKEFHEQNLFLDKLWYRFLTVNHDIMLPIIYVDYKVHLAEYFDVVETHDDINNEVLYLRPRVLEYAC